jgi:hypothetical protein
VVDTGSFYPDIPTMIEILDFGPRIDETHIGLPGGKFYEIAVGFEEFLNKIFRWK